MRWPRSLALRLALAAGLWVAVGLGAAAWFVTGVAVRGVEGAFDARLSGLLDAAVAATATDAEGRIVVARAPAGADFERPFGGAYWQVTAPDGSVTTSRSLWDQALPAAAGGHDGVLLRDVAGPRGERLRLAERDLLLPGAAAPVHVGVALSRAETEAEIGRLRTLLLLTFAVVGLGLVAGVVGTVVAGLAPLRRVRSALAEIRDGRRERLGIAAPSEIAPLVAEVDALIAANRATVERARSHVGNLAHALKTPLAVLRNALDRASPDIVAARAEASALERLVHHHLARARVAALASSSAAESSPRAIADDVARALRRLFEERGLVIEVRGDPGARVRVDPQDLAEMLGNLMENACRWARQRVGVTVAAEGKLVVVTIADDGPGLPEGVRDAVLGRGVRLDEREAGSGLGLAIVADLASLHGGSLELGRAGEGGLLAALRLPGHAALAAS
ncbi:sensor histidine kinase [Falsiroseomonas bella]|uniref:histidine kinase n=1 Tax=Falsiroseomonas bella TaxID=2184016 RepID=A0A317FCY4_9PROT|nr:HAMP domain-containing sensor histidine kinase [Falsiroseomonas bella]PWS35887.1 sensor histidine kinase [Falsiroseomonas bella]